MNGKNIRTRKKIREALPTMPAPFTSHDLSAATGFSPQRVQGLLRGMTGVERIQVTRRKGVRVNYILVARNSDSFRLNDTTEETIIDE